METETLVTNSPTETQRFTDVDLTKLNIPRLILWYDALMSGDYTRIKGQLREMKDGKPCFCALGVACDVYRTNAKKGRWDDKAFVVVNQENYMDLPSTVARWFGFQVSRRNWGEDNDYVVYMAPDVHIRGREDLTSFMEMNDDLNWSFKKTAAKVRQLIVRAAVAQG